MDENLKLVIWVVVIGGAFLFLWRKGFIAKIANYVSETREELRKCTWPSWDELKGSTIVVLVTVVMLGVFTVAADFLITQLVQFLTA